MEVVLDGRLMTSRESVHDLLFERLDLPAYYGRNLDALYDVLTSCPQKLDITIVHASDVISNLGSYAEALFATFQDAVQANPNVTFSVSNEII